MSAPQKPEFDQLSTSYEELLRDPIRDKFAGESIFFHIRKRDLIREFFTSQKVDTRRLSYLDVGCGKGELLGLLREDFGHRAGCDPSSEMMASLGQGIDARVQTDPLKLPFEDQQFDFATAVCVYHHVPVEERSAITAEIHRVLKPGGIFGLIEHNPYNPATQMIVKRTPVDANAILLSQSEGRRWLRQAGFSPVDQPYFLFFPKPIYEKAGGAEKLLRSVPLGGQYAIFARR